MNRGQLVIKNVFRNRRRSILTVSSIAVSVVLLMMFSAFTRFLESPPEVGSGRLMLIVSARSSPIQCLPVSYRPRIEKLPGVRAVTQVYFIDALWKNPDSVIPSLSLDPSTLFIFFPGWRLPEDQRKQFMNEKAAAIAGRHTAEKYGWKVGERLHVTSPHYSLFGIDLHLVGIYDSPDQESYLVYHWDYLNDVLGSPNTTDMFWVLAGSERDMPVLMKSVDEEFRNMGTPTLTQTVKQMVLNFLSWLGNVRLILLSVSGAVVFAVFLILANTMAMSIRERTVELAVLRALGYSLRQVLVILTGESLALAIAGAALGCLLASALCRVVAGYAIGGGLRVELSVGWVGACQALGLAAFVGLFSTLLPAYRTWRVGIAEALRFVG
jgi:putative ABC transport system permease protein